MYIHTNTIYVHVKLYFINVKRPWSAYVANPVTKWTLFLIFESVSIVLIYQILMQPFSYLIRVNQNHGKPFDLSRIVILYSIGSPSRINTHTLFVSYITGCLTKETFKNKKQNFQEQIQD